MLRLNTHLKKLCAFVKFHHFPFRILSWSGTMDTWNLLETFAFDFFGFIVDFRKNCMFRHCWEKMVADSITLDLNRGQWVIPVQQREDVVRWVFFQQTKLEQFESAVRGPTSCLFAYIPRKPYEKPPVVGGCFWWDKSTYPAVNRAIVVWPYQLQVGLQFHL